MEGEGEELFPSSIDPKLTTLPTFHTQRFLFILTFQTIRLIKQPSSSLSPFLHNLQSQLGVCSTPQTNSEFFFTLVENGERNIFILSDVKFNLSPFLLLQSTACVLTHFLHWVRISLKKSEKNAFLYSISVVLLSHTPKKLQMCLPSFCFLISSSPPPPSAFFFPGISH